jgi:hypothetical protein
LLIKKWIATVATRVTSHYVVSIQMAAVVVVVVVIIVLIASLRVMSML